jgi:protein phosphatase
LFTIGGEMPVFDFFKNMFNDKPSSMKEDGPADPVPGRDLTEKQPPMPQSLFQVAACQSSGRERAHNEDTLFTLEAFLAGYHEPQSVGIYLVADGMGGHQSGEIASHLAARGAAEFLLDALYRPIVFEGKTFEDAELKRLVKEAVDAAQELIQQNVPGGGTTLTLVLAVGERLFSAHVGDSRLYLISADGSLSVRTKDHSLVKRLVDLGQITEQEASTHPQRNVLYRALGQAEPFEADVDQISLTIGDRLMICSDGLWGSVSTRRLKEIIESTSDLDSLGCLLVDAANEAGGPDNISVVLVQRVA